MACGTSTGENAPACTAWWSCADELRHFFLMYIYQNFRALKY